MGRVGIDDIEDLRGLKLDRDGQLELLDSATECTFVFSSSGGWPSGVVMSFLHEDDRFWLTAVRGRAHAEAMLRDPRATLVVSSAGTALARRMLSVRGRVRLHDDRRTKDWFFPRFARRLASADPDAFVRLLDSHDRVVFEMVPVGIAASHDSRRMPGDGRGGRESAR